MKIKCTYCRAFINDYDEVCPNCGGHNDNLKRNANNVPQTIEELKQWYVDHNLPNYYTTRFFIGENYLYPKAFGIYKDEQTGNFIVYKNKDTGERSIRYEGKDEAYAVNELYMKLKEEILHQKENNLHSGSTQIKSKKIVLSLGKILALCFFVQLLFGLIGFLIFTSTKSNGYYKYNDTYYYYQSGSWYKYSDYGGWHSATPPDELKSNSSDYYDSYSYSSDYDIDDFSDSDYYRPPSSSSSSSDSSYSSDWDSSSSWDSGSSWDSSSTDWSSDW